MPSRYGFASAKAMYDRFSNLCHHNGSGHKMLAESMRITDVITSESGKSYYSDGDATAVMFGYPSASFASNSLALTARVTWWSAVSAERFISDLREAPFLDKELHRLTRGRITSAETFFRGSSPQSNHTPSWEKPKIGRNDLCSCGSGKKFKLCCGTKLI
jgi:hypothetical protein